MKIIISPAKQMKVPDVHLFDCTAPVFPKQSRALVNDLKAMDEEKLQQALACSKKLADTAFQAYQSLDPEANGSPALFTYHGIQYQTMAPDVLEDEAVFFLQDHLYIISALYGLLRPLDAIMVHRLEMQNKIPYSLYEFWGSSLADAIQDPVILNLASEEYARTIRKYKPVIDVSFFENSRGKLLQKGVYVKMARGEMVRYIAENRIEDPQGLYAFTGLGYRMDTDRSTPDHLVFVRQNEKPG